MYKKFYSLSDCTDFSEEKTAFLFQECGIREKIDNDLRDIYICEAIEGLISFVKKNYEVNKDVSLWICFLSGISLSQIERIMKNPEKEIVFEGLHQNLSKKTITEKLGIPEETVERYYLDFENCSYVNHLLPELCMPCEYKKHLYEKYLYKGR